VCGCARANSCKGGEGLTADAWMRIFRVMDIDDIGVSPEIAKCLCVYSSVWVRAREFV